MSKSKPAPAASHGGRAKRHPILRGGIIGAGYFGRIQLEAWQRVEGATIAAICDVDHDRAKAISSHFGIERAYADVETMLDREQLDFVDIVTRPESHVALIRLAADRGLAVLCQKPLAPSFDEAQAVVDLCHQHRVRLMVNENWRWQPWYRRIKQMIAEGTIGQVYHARFVVRRGDGRGERPYIRQPYFREMPRLLIYETLIHVIDVARMLWGDVSAVHALHRRLNECIAGEDFALLLLKMSGEVTVLIDADRYAPPLMDNPRVPEAVTVEGLRGRLTLEPDGSIGCVPIEGQTWRETPAWPEQGYQGNSCHSTQQHFIDALHTGQPFETNGQDNLNTLRSIFAAYESAEAGCFIRL